MTKYRNMQKFLNEYSRLSNLVEILSHSSPEVSSTTLSLLGDGSKRKVIEMPMELKNDWLEGSKRLLKEFEALTYEEWIEREGLNDIRQDK